MKIGVKIGVGILAAVDLAMASAYADDVSISATAANTISVDVAQRRSPHEAAGLQHGGTVRRPPQGETRRLDRQAALHNL